ncbi:MAG: hypothetical protein CVT89_02295 [Candidatus Altiarchaeales archaeon HGW-Altiarchaeales-2]|nr:MAG: hypothetical protein CVT89_02295 [Candidatus Altiarchaeales archaeon HGW-Altiarchaeales-2]
MEFYYYNILPIIGDEKISPKKSKLFNYNECVHSSDEYVEYKVAMTTSKGKNEYDEHNNGKIFTEDEIKITSATYNLKIYNDKVVEINLNCDVKNEILIYEIFMGIYNDLRSNNHKHLFSNLEKGVHIMYKNTSSDIAAKDIKKEKVRKEIYEEYIKIR